MSNNIVPLTVENFTEIVGEQSQQKLIAVVFWAAQEQSSVDLKTAVERLASRYENHLIAAMVDVEEQPQITAQFGVRGLPTIILVKEGQPVDGAAGPMDDVQVGELLQKHLPKPEDELMLSASEFVSEGDYQQAYTAAKQAFDLAPDRIDARFLLADCSVELGQVEAAKMLLADVKLADQDAQYQVLMGKIDLAEKAAESPEIIELQKRLESEPDNLDLKIQLAVQLKQANKIEQALDLLYQVVQKDLGYADAKKTIIEMVNALPDGDPLKSKFRRKIYSLLY
ncbi:MAG: tetratricopeptide repeat protein [Pseudomonadota bacterium]